MIRSRALASVTSTLLFVACTDASLGDLARVDGAVVSTPDAATTAPDVNPRETPPDAPSVASDVPVLVGDDVVAATPDVVESRPDVVTPPMDVVVPRPDVVTPPVDVVTPRPDVVIQPDLPTVCEACTPFAPVTFCRGTGSGACLAYAGCRDNCSTCIPATVAGDSCANAPVIATTGRTRTVLTTCGATDNLGAGCGRSGPDIAFVLRVARTSNVRLSITVPEGVGVVFGYDRSPGACRNDSTFRLCNDSTPARTQDYVGPLSAGDWPIYVVTTVPSTVVVETELP